MKTLITLILTVLLVQPALAKTKRSTTKTTSSSDVKSIDMDRQFDRLGSNEAIIEKAKALNPNNSMRIVQKREVDRNLRLEIGGSYGLVNGGDSYIESRHWTGNLDFHINPRWSLGLRYTQNKNDFTSEGKRVFDLAQQRQDAGERFTAPAVDYPLQTYLAMVSWYPVYGKVSWFESAISQFDFYLTAGGGQAKLYSGDNSTVLTGGVGMGMWINSWITSRIEARYQNYKDRVITGERNIDSFVFQIGFGIML